MSKIGGYMDVAATRNLAFLFHSFYTMLRPAMYVLLVAALATRPQSADTIIPFSTANSLGRFPHVEGSNLEGERFALPSDFKGELNVVLVAFKREQQSDVDSWMPALKTMAGARGDLRIYEIPTLGRRYRLMRSFIDRGMRSGIPDQAVRSATITLYIDKSPFRKALKLADEDRIYVLLVDRDGRVHWRADGRFDEKSAAELKLRLEGNPAKTGDRSRT